MNNNQSLWRVVSVTNFGDQPAISGATQFGFYVHTGECYHIDYEKGNLGLIENDGLIWTAGETDPGCAPIHYYVKLKTAR